jgi:copper oxidase (laccase) domain-containing protein
LTYLILLKKSQKLDKNIIFEGAIAPYCTYQTPEYFFSYRWEKQKKVQWSGIVSNDL